MTGTSERGAAQRECDFAMAAFRYGESMDQLLFSKLFSDCGSRATDLYPPPAEACRGFRLNV